MNSPEEDSFNQFSNCMINNDIVLHSASQETLEPEYG